MSHAPDILLLELFAIFVWAKVFAEVFERLALPAVLGEILAGVVLGPYALGVVQPSPTVNSIAQLGAIFLLFVAGLETHPKELVRVGRQSLTVAIAGVIVPFVLGFGYMLLHGSPSHEATFVAAAMVATSVGITARVLSDMHVLQTRVARIILGAAVFDDILGMVLLAVVVGLASELGVQWTQLIVLALEAVGFALFMIFIGPRIVARIRPGLERMSTRNAPLVLALAICLGLSVAAERIGLAAIIGAFFAGLAFAEYSREWNLEMRAHAINEFLAPYFFFTMGALLDFHVFGASGVLTAAIVVSVLALISKVVGCGLPVLRDGWRAALRVGVGMTPRGEVALIVALIGLNMRIVSNRTYAIVVFMTAVTTIVAPPVLRCLFRTGPEEPVPVRAAAGPVAVE
ncbi:MAG TPA: cation:proton antiporter [Terriglobales bacterium]|nr:cation:proton antiporter [Terriglobales bacterium]